MKSHPERDHKTIGITQGDVVDLTMAVEDLKVGISDLNKKMDRQWVVLRNKRIKMVVSLVVAGIFFTVVAVQLTDQHTRDCMVFGSVPDEQQHRECNVLFPFHDHPQGGISDEHLRRAIERARSLQAS